MSAFINTCCQREKLWYALLMMANKPETAVRSSPSFFSWHHMFFSTWRWNFVRITSFPWQLHVYMTTTYCWNSFRHFSSNLQHTRRWNLVYSQYTGVIAFLSPISLSLSGASWKTQRPWQPPELHTLVLSLVWFLLPWCIVFPGPSQRKCWHVAVARMTPIHTVIPSFLGYKSRHTGLYPRCFLYRPRALPSCGTDHHLGYIFTI